MFELVKSDGEAESLTENEVKERLDDLKLYEENPLWGYGGEL